MARPVSGLPPYRAQLAQLVSAPPEGDGWLHEVKYDGYRIGAEVAAGRARLWSRRGREWTRAFPEVAAAAARLPVRAALLDGEVAAVLPDGRTSFQLLQNAFAAGPRPPIAYFVFDLLHLDGEDLRRGRSPSARPPWPGSSRAPPRCCGTRRTSRAAAPRCSARRAASASRASCRSAPRTRTGPGAARGG